MILFTDYLYKGIGGVGQLVVNTILQLNKIGQQAKVYCSRESYEYQRLIQTKATFIHIDSDAVSLKELPNYVDKEDVLYITHINNTPLLEKLKPLNNRMFFYSVHPDTFFCYPTKMNILCNQKRAALELVEFLQRKDALFLMDGPNVDGIVRRGGQLQYSDCRYIPVPVFSYIDNKRFQKPKSDVFNITYVGRGNSDWKIYPVIKVLQDLNQIRKRSIQLTIITDKNERFQELIKEHVPDNEIKITYINNMFGEELEQYLFNNSCLHISMGTSALEGGKLGIPTILIDCSQKLFPPDYLYHWIYQSTNFGLGDDITDKEEFSGYTISAIIENIEDPLQYKNVSVDCYNYVINNHSMDRYIKSIICASLDTRLTVKDYCGTRFSRNMRVVKPIIEILAKVKRIGRM